LEFHKADVSKINRDTKGGKYCLYFQEFVPVGAGKCHPRRRHLEHPFGVE
jgi:hypothetical protein